MRLLLHELKGELRLYTRSRELAFFTFMLPIIFFVLLGSVYGDEDMINGYRGPDYLLTGMIGYGVAATAFSGLAIVLVIRRESGVLKRLRATPLPAPVYIAAVSADDADRLRRRGDRPRRARHGAVRRRVSEEPPVRHRRDPARKRRRSPSSGSE